MVTCARCGAEYPEASEAIRYASGDWWCTYEEDCDERLFEAQQVKGHPDGF